MSKWLDIARSFESEPLAKLDKTDKTTEQTPKSAGLGSSVRFVRIVQGDESQHFDTAVIAWINANPPDLPMHQNHCAACSAFIPVYDTGWVYLGDGVLIHHGGEHGRECFDRWQDMRREEAEWALARL